MPNTPKGSHLERGLTVSQASRLMQLYRLQAAQRPTWTLASSSSSIGGSDSGNTSNSAASSASRGECHRRSQASLRLLRELLRRDYAMGYLLLGWVLRTTWQQQAQQLPNATMAAAEAGQDEDQQVLLQLLGAEGLQQLQQQLVGPTAALASMATFMKAQQTLAGAPATAQQVLDFMRKEQQLMELFQGTNLADNLAAATSAVAATAQVSATHSNAEKAASALAVLAQLKVSKAVQQVVPQLFVKFNGDSSSNSQAAGVAAELLLDPAAVLAQLQVLQQRLPTQQDKAAMLQEYQAWLDSVKDCLVQQHEQTQVHLSSLKSDLASAATNLRQSEACRAQVEQQQVQLQQAKQQALGRYQQARQAIQQMQQQVASGGALLASVAAQGPAPVDGAAVAATGEPGSSSSSAAWPGQLSLDVARATAEVAKADLAVAEQQLEQLQTDNSVVRSDNKHLKAQLQDLQASYSQLVRACSSQVAARADLDDAMVSLDAAVAGVADNADKAADELDALMGLLLGQAKQLQQQGPAAAGAGADEALTVGPMAAGAADAGISDTQAAQLLAAAESVLADGRQHDADQLLASADKILAEVEGIVGPGAAAPQSQQQQQPTSAASGTAAISSSSSVDSLQNDNRQQQQQQQQPPSPRQAGGKRTVRVLVPPKPKGFSHTAVLFIDRPSQQRQQAGQQPESALQAALQKFVLLDGACSADSASGEVAPSRHDLAAVFGKVPNLPGIEAMLADLIAASSKQASLLTSSISSISSAWGSRSSSVGGWLQEQRWSHSAEWEAKAAWLHMWASSQLASGSEAAQHVAAAAAQLPADAAAAAARAAAEVEAAKRRVDGKGPGEQRTLKEEVLAASGMLSLISPNWWTEEALGCAAAEARGPTTAKAATATAADGPMLQEAFGSDGSGMEGAGGSGAGKGPGSSGSSGSSGGSGDPADDDQAGGGGGAGNDGGSGGAGAGGGGNDLATAAAAPGMTALRTTRQQMGWILCGASTLQALLGSTEPAAAPAAAAAACHSSLGGSSAQASPPLVFPAGLPARIHAKDQKLAASTAYNVQLQAELDAALSGLASAAGAKQADGGIAAPSAGKSRDAGSVGVTS
ncbi:hypothetical protein COO60DRAFT_1636249 [Scenedesmus sp. NREL 46B-D3]|nr:hypothetical protein COO60DRAFT_1636249 [Scenedesmus sp. NREL 46B-D3]